MLLIEEKLTQLYTGCNQVLEALRNVMTNKTFGVLNNPQFEDLLISLSATADEILEYDPQQRQDEIFNRVTNAFNPMLKEQMYYQIFNSTLQTMLKLNPGLSADFSVEEAVNITNKAMEQLNHQVEQ